MPRYVPLLAAWELETRDTRAPIERAAGLKELRCVPESAVVHRVHRHGTVISPAVQVR